ncbi:MAG: hypothetical protein GKR92_03155 [Gammaproteobacteria bacterium]|nr:MAG: hypothetical protein GKR92_03155 [Gammaproteobacteria bacterium]
MFKYFAPKVLKLLTIVSLVLAFLVLSNIYTYKRLVAEKPIAQLTFTPVSIQEFDATLRLGNFCEESIYRIYGDEWRIDSQFLKWKSWATLFGLNAMYRIDRLSGRYSKIEDEKTKNHSAHDLKTTSTLDLAKVADRYKNKFPPVDTVYGSSAYKNMKPNTLYTVFVTQSGILIREQDLSTITPQNECVVGKSQWKDTIVGLDQKLVSLVGSIK